MKGGSITFAQLATEWLLQSSAILQNVFLHDAFVTALRKAEQFLWAGSEMDSVSSIYLLLFNILRYIHTVIYLTKFCFFLGCRFETW